MIVLIAITLAASGANRQSAWPILVPGPELWPSHIHGDGTTVIKIETETDGRPLRCKALENSAAKDFEDVTCQLILQRLAIAPRNADKFTGNVYAVQWRLNKKSAGNLDGAIPIDPQNWVRPEDFGPYVLTQKGDAIVDMAFTISVTGMIENCVVTQSTATADLSAMTCRLLIQRATFLPSLNEDGTARIAHGKYRVTWKATTPSDGETKIVFDPQQSDDTVCFAEVDDIKRQLTKSFCSRLAESVIESGGTISYFVGMKFDGPLPFATPD
jgi:hypothetical protein